MMKRPSITALLAAVLAAITVVGGCATAAVGDLADRASAPTTIENYPDAQTRALAVLARAPRPVENSAMPPRHLDAEAFPTILVDRSGIVSGGQSPDAIPSIDEPNFDDVADVDWLADNEPVAVVTVDDGTHIYPLQIMIWHEIVNDVIANKPIALTYCPLCNSVVAFERTVDDRVLDFGTSGALYQSALVMYDRQTESLWTHFDGHAVVGTLIGAELLHIPAATVTWAEASAEYTDALVLNRDTGRDIRYGRSPYASYEQTPGAPAGFFRGPVDGRLEPKVRVVGIVGESAEVAVPTDTLRDVGTSSVAVGGQTVVVFWTSGQTSAIDGELVSEGRDVGSTGVFEPIVDDQRLTFHRTPAGFIDDQTGSTWSITGRALAGELVGAQLPPVVHLDTFWFAWSSYYPATDVTP